VCIVTNKIWNALSGALFPAEAIDFRLEKAQTVSEAHPASYLMGTGVLPGQQGGQTVKLNTYLDLQSRIRRSGVIPRTCTSLDVLVMWTEEGFRLRYFTISSVLTCISNVPKWIPVLTNSTCTQPNTTFVSK
jgi:hypothetical protein